MAVHELKTWPDAFDAVWRGDKGYEIREDDRVYRVGDVLVLRRWDPEKAAFTGQRISALVSYKTEGGSWGLPKHLCVLSLQNVVRIEEADVGESPVFYAPKNRPRAADYGFPNCRDCGRDCRHTACGCDCHNGEYP